MADNAVQDNSNEGLLTEEDVRTHGLSELTVTGFSVMCAWHFLTLFTATPATGEAVAGGRPVVAFGSLYMAGQVRKAFRQG